MACTLADGRTVEAAVTELTGQTGEKHVVAGYESIEAPFISAYMHVITGKLAAIVGFNKEIDAQVAKGVAMQVASMNPVAVAAENVEQSILDAEYKTAIEKTKEELVQKDINAALTKVGINPAHVDSEDHIESNQSKGWITAEQAAQAREIIQTVGEAKRANLNMTMIENIAKGRVQKFLKENTLVEQGYQMGDGKTPVKDVIKAADAEAKVLVFKRVSLAD